MRAYELIIFFSHRYVFDEKISRQNSIRNDRVVKWVVFISLLNATFQNSFH